MRDFINIMDLTESIPERASVVEADDDEGVDVMHELRDIVFRLRSYQSIDQSEQDGDTAFESGLEMAAEMLDNLLNRLGDNSGS